LRLNQFSVLINRLGTFYGWNNLLEHVYCHKSFIFIIIPYVIRRKIGYSNSCLLHATRGIIMPNLARSTFGGNMPPKFVSVLNTCGKQIR